MVAGIAKMVVSVIVVVWITKSVISVDAAVRIAEMALLVVVVVWTTQLVVFARCGRPDHENGCSRHNR